MYQVYRYIILRFIYDWHISHQVESDFLEHFTILLGIFLLRIFYNDHIVSKHYEVVGMQDLEHERHMILKSLIRLYFFFTIGPRPNIYHLECLIRIRSIVVRIIFF